MARGKGRKGGGEEETKKGVLVKPVFFSLKKSKHHTSRKSDFCVCMHVSHKSWGKGERGGKLSRLVGVSSESNDDPQG